jgi:hypothetical protein
LEVIYLLQKIIRKPSNLIFTSVYFEFILTWYVMIIFFSLYSIYYCKNRLGFHLAIEQLVQAVKQKRSLFGRVIDSLEDAFRAMDSSGRGSLEETDLARALHRLGNICIYF